MTLGRIRLAGALAALLALLVLSALGTFRVSQPVFDTWQRLAPHDLSESEVRIVWIDDKAVAELGNWPWPRRQTALLIDAVAALEPKVIGLDMFFAEPDGFGPEAFLRNNPELPPSTAAALATMESLDARLARSVGDAPVVVGRAGVDAARQPGAPDFAVIERFSAPLPKIYPQWGDLITNLAEIDILATGYGLLNGPQDSDGVVRRVPLAANVAGRDQPGLALELAMQWHGVEQAVVDGGRISVAGSPVAADADGGLAPKLGQIPSAFTASAFDVLAGTVRADAFKGKIVIIALNATGTADQVTTPLSSAVYGAEVQANAVDAILSGKALVRPAWAGLVEAVATIVAAGLCILILPRLRGWPAGALTIVMFGGLIGMSGASFFAAGWLIDPVKPVAASLATGITMVLLLFARSRRQRRDLSARLQEERVSAAQAQGELNAAHTIQLGMLPPPERLAKLDPHLEIAGLVEPARSIGGDFFDCVTIAPGVHAFIVGDVSGKGVPAALFMALSKALTKSVLLRGGAGLAKAMGQINEEVSRDNSEDMFVTLLVAVFDVQTGALCLCAAGHEYPWMVRADRSIDMIKPDGGPPIGVAPGFVYGSSTSHLGVGDTLIIVSDGITEAKAPDEDYFEHSRLRAVLQDWQQERGVDGLIGGLRDAVRIFEAGEEATDDLTVLAVRRLA